MSLLQAIRKKETDGQARHEAHRHRVVGRSRGSSRRSDDRIEVTLPHDRVDALVPREPLESGAIRRARAMAAVEAMQRQSAKRVLGPEDIEAEIAAARRERKTAE